MGIRVREGDDPGARLVVLVVIEVGHARAILVGVVRESQAPRCASLSRKCRAQRRMLSVPDQVVVLALCTLIAAPVVVVAPV